MKIAIFMENKTKKEHGNEQSEMSLNRLQSNLTLDIAEEERTYTCRGPAKKGTTRFMRIASASVIWRGLQLMLALTCVGNYSGASDAGGARSWQMRSG